MSRDERASGSRAQRAIRRGEAALGEAGEQDEGNRARSAREAGAGVGRSAARAHGERWRPSFEPARLGTTTPAPPEAVGFGRHRHGAAGGVGVAISGAISGESDSLLSL